MDRREYEAVPGFFVQDDPEQEYIPEILPRFGLIDKGPDRWTTFVDKLRELHETAGPGVQYKVFFLGRHGEGYHNLGEERHPDNWDEYWVKLNSDEDIIWGPDARLTELGQRQARDAHSVWKEELGFNIPIPGMFYTSPMTRAIQTHQLTFDAPVVIGCGATILENVRRYYGAFTPDKRRPRSEIQEEFPEYLFEDGFAEVDPLEELDYYETHEDAVKRARKVLDAIFDKDENQVISITSHGGFLFALLDSVGHRSWKLPMGAVIPVVIKGTIKKGRLRN